MKKILFIMLISGSIISQLWAQEQTLVEFNKIEHGGFGAVVTKYTKINNEFGVLVGGRGGWIIDHSFIIGGGGYGLANNIKGNIPVEGKRRSLAFGYGGLELEYILHSDALIHMSIYSLIGAGGINYHYYKDNDWRYDWDVEKNTFFIWEPAVNVEVNVTSFFRLHFGAGYRVISGVSFDELKNSDLGGPSANLTLKFGKF